MLSAFLCVYKLRRATFEARGGRGAGGQERHAQRAPLSSAAFLTAHAARLCRPAYGWFTCCWGGQWEVASSGMAQNGCQAAPERRSSTDQKPLCNLGDQDLRQRLAVAIFAAVVLLSLHFVDDDLKLGREGAGESTNFAGRRFRNLRAARAAGGAYIASPGIPIIKKLSQIP